MSIVRDLLGNYEPGHTTTEEDILRAAEEILEQRMMRLDTLTCPSDTARFLKAKLAAYPYEVFACIFVDNRHRVIAFEELFRGSIDGCSVHPREVMRRALHHNAAAVIFSHNHPSVVSEPSQADRDITRQLQQALKYIEVRVLDHFVCGSGEPLSLAERGWL